MVLLIVILILSLLVLSLFLGIYKQRVKDANDRIINLTNNIHRIGEELNRLQIEKIKGSSVENNKTTVNNFKIDDILNEISKYGIESLSKSKLEFLKKYKHDK